MGAHDPQCVCVSRVYLHRGGMSKYRERSVGHTRWLNVNFKDERRRQRRWETSWRHGVMASWRRPAPIHSTLDAECIGWRRDDGHGVRCSESVRATDAGNWIDCERHGRRKAGRFQNGRQFQWHLIIPHLIECGAKLETSICIRP